MYRDTPELTKEERFAHYTCEADAVMEIAKLVNDDQAQAACNRLAKHVRQHAEISANAEYGIMLVEQAFIRGRAHDAEIKKQIERIKTWCRMNGVLEENRDPEANELTGACDNSRIDWLESNSGHFQDDSATKIELWPDDATREWHLRIGKSITGYGPSIREAIDCARAKGAADKAMEGYDPEPLKQRLRQVYEEAKEKAGRACVHGIAADRPCLSCPTWRRMWQKEDSQRKENTRISQSHEK